MNNTLKLIKKIIYISNMDKGSIGFNNILIYGFLSGFAELLIFASSIYIISLISNDSELLKQQPGYNTLYNSLHRSVQILLENNFKEKSFLFFLYSFP